MNLHSFFDVYVQVLGYFIYIVIALAFLSAYYEVKKTYELNNRESNNSQNQEINGTPNVPG